MRKMTKSLLKAALAFGLTGAAFGISSLCFGFSGSEFVEAVEDGRFSLTIPEDWGDRIRETFSGLDVGNGNAKQNFTQRFVGVESLKLDLGVADCRIRFGEDDEWSVGGHNLPDRYEIRIDDGELRVDYRNRPWTWFRFGKKAENAWLEISIPRTQITEEIDIDMGIGSLETADGILRCEELEIDSGVGSCTLIADIGERIKIDGGVGDVDLTLIGKETDFNYKIDHGVGEVTVGSNRYSDLGGEHEISHGADRELEIDSGIGTVRVQFAEAVGGVHEDDAEHEEAEHGADEGHEDEAEHGVSADHESDEDHEADGKHQTGGRT